MKTRICDKCHKPISGPRHMIIPVGKPGQVFDICTHCMASFMAPRQTNKKPSKPRHLYDIPLDDSPIREIPINLTSTQHDGCLGLSQGNSPPLIF